MTTPGIIGMVHAYKMREVGESNSLREVKIKKGDKMALHSRGWKKLYQKDLAFL